jgi:hypothetical protein
MTAAVKPFLNPLHIYCRLRDLYMPREAAVLLCRLYERSLFKFLMMKEGIMR